MLKYINAKSIKCLTINKCKTYTKYENIKYDKPGVYYCYLSSSNEPYSYVCDTYNAIPVNSRLKCLKIQLKILKEEIKEIEDLCENTAQNTH